MFKNNAKTIADDSSAFLQVDPHDLGWNESLVVRLYCTWGKELTSNLTQDHQARDHHQVGAGQSHAEQEGISSRGATLWSSSGKHREDVLRGQS